MQPLTRRARIPIEVECVEVECVGVNVVTPKDLVLVTFSVLNKHLAL